MTSDDSGSPAGGNGSDPGGSAHYTCTSLQTIQPSSRDVQSLFGAYTVLSWCTAAIKEDRCFFERYSRRDCRVRERAPNEFCYTRGHLVVVVQLSPGVRFRVPVPQFLEFDGRLRDVEVDARDGKALWDWFEALADDLAVLDLDAFELSLPLGDASVQRWS